MEIETLPLWILVSLLYMLSAIYYNMRYKEWIPKVIPAALFTFGAGIFIATNQSSVLSGVEDADWVELVVMTFITLGWIFSILSVREYTELRKRYGLKVADDWGGQEDD